MISDAGQLFHYCISILHQFLIYVNKYFVPTDVLLDYNVIATKHWFTSVISDALLDSILT